ncbi:hypothetical protein IGI37_001843 [Enterococcus sp. AZ194]|uniref:hypothetical protein n=1 Tax=Enterococcus sp. AZ194 TaxID=2774629 RepID=UPI003F2359B9
MAEKKREGWFFTKNILDEINELSDDDFLDEASEEKPKTIEKEEKVVPINRETDFVTVAEKETNQQVLDQELTRLKSELKQIKEEAMKEPTVSLDTLVATQQDYESKLTELKEENKRLQESKRTSMQREDQLLDQLKEAETTYEALKKQWSDATAQLEAKDTTRDKLKMRVMEVENELAETQAIVAEKDQLLAQKEEEATSIHEGLQATHEKFAQLSQHLTEEKEKSAQLTDLLEVKERQIEGFQVQEARSSQNEERYHQLERQVAELLKENNTLTHELNQAKQGIGEVLIVAKKQAQQFVDEAKLEANQLIRAAKIESEQIESQAKQISYEINKSRQTVSEIYDVLEKKVNQLFDPRRATERDSRREQA